MDQLRNAEIPQVKKRILDLLGGESELLKPRACRSLGSESQS